MILIIDLCYEKDSLSSLEFVQPIKRIAESAETKTQIIHFSELNDTIIKKSDKIILCGTALKDNEFLNHKDKFGWLTTTKKPVLGICAGMQIIATAFGSKITKQKEIGMKEIIAKDKLFGKELLNVYELHGNGITTPKGFEIVAENQMGIQAIRKNNIYGIVFHPEVRNHQIIKNFLKIQ